ncbi:GNAT family N-acetyltransferase [Macrococcus equi]|uniref:GNAT family N-acetyltransferase n=1 Tax=Macrococcus equi TaxID=3395462 RepID=UPI0039BDE74F
MIIRQAEVSDAVNLLEYTKIVGRESDNLLFGSEGIGYTIEEEEKIIESIGNHARQIMLVATDNQEVVGLAQLVGLNRERVAHQGRLAISVRKDYWGKGVSTQLMQGLIDFANQTNMEVIALEVYADNIRGIKLYEKFGFKQIGLFKHYAKVKDEYKDAIMMTLQIK